jgi:PAS domain S-box-containing protein
MHDRGKTLENVQYSLEGTPCAEVIYQKRCRFPTGVQKLFPKDHWLVELGIDSYVGMPLVSTHGQVIGLMAIMDRKAMQRVEVAEATLSIFAARTAAELQRQQAELSLRQQEEMLRRIVDSVPGGVFTIGPDGAILQANDEAQRFLGLSWEQLRTRRVADWEGRVVWENGRPAAIADLPVTRCLQTGQAQPRAVIGVCQENGQQRWGLFSTVPYLDAGTNQPAGAIVTFLDITERRRDEEKLRQSEEYHRVISELTSDYAYDYRVNADHSMTLVAMTEGLTRVTGYTVGELERAGGWPHLIHPEDRPLVEQRASALFAGQATVEELRIVTKSGQVRWIRYSTLPLWDKEQDRVVRLVGAVQDITERKHYEDQLDNYAQQLQALSRRLLDVQEEERRHIARELHDEIGQRLTGLKFALDMDTRVPPTEMRAHLAKAQEIVKDLTAHVRDLSMVLRPTMLDDLGLVPALRWHLRRFTEQTKIQVAFEHELDRRLPADLETAAYRIVQEALTNVARHSQAPQATVRLWLDGEVLWLQIEDRGRGFDVDTVQKTVTSSGLSGMQERARLLGGRLNIQSRLGRGTCLIAELPCTDTPQESSHAQHTVLG